MSRIVTMAAFAALAAPAFAATVIVQAADQGWYTAAGSHIPTNVNISTGELFSDGRYIEYRSFFVFDLSGIGQATSVSIQFAPLNGQYQSDGSERIALFDFGGSINALVDGSGGGAAFADLGTGVQYGDFTVVGQGSANMPGFTVALGADFLAKLNATRLAADKRIVIGAALQTINPGGLTDRFWAGSTITPAAALRVSNDPLPAVPEPATWATMIAGFALVGGAVRRVRLLAGGWRDRPVGAR